MIENQYIYIIKISFCINVREEMVVVFYVCPSFSTSTSDDSKEQTNGREHSSLKNEKNVTENDLGIL